ncbi:MAG: TolC family protein [Steroidobacteraceae bacterium]|jgi:outer membrane protein TolC|nr:TolC family protein [Steroidobacteraceae bacterium]
MRESILLLLFVGLSGFAHGAGAVETLEQAWRRALDNDQVLAASRHETQAARMDATAARAARYPTLSASGSYVQLDDAPAFDFSAAGILTQMPGIIDHDNAAIASATVTMPLYTGGRISNDIAAAREMLRARELGETQTAQDLKLAVAIAYVDVLRAQRALEVADSNVASLESYAREVTSAFEREVAPRNDLLSAQVALADARQKRIRAANGLELARAAYNRRLGEPLARHVELDPTLPDLQPDLTAQPLEQLVARALDARPELRALNAQSQALQHRADAERARGLPQVSLSGGYTYLENEVFDRDRFAVAMLGFSWAVFDGGQIRSRSSALRSASRALESRARDRESLIALDVRQAWLDVQETRSRVDVTREAVEQSEENLRITRSQYRAELVTSTRVLEAESLRVLSRTNHHDAVLDHALARYRLARAVGEL